MTNSKIVANETARFIARASAMSVAVAFGRRRTNASLRPSRRTRRLPSLSPSGPAVGVRSGGLSSITNSCATSLDGGRQPLSTASVLLVGVPLRTIAHPSSNRCVASSDSTLAMASRGAVAPRTPIAISRSKPVVSHGGGSGTRMPIPTSTAASKSIIQRHGSATIRAPAGSRLSHDSAFAGSGASARSSGIGLPTTSGSVWP